MPPVLPDSLDAFGPAALAAVIAAAYLVVGEPVAGAVLHRRFEGRLRSDPRARRSFYRRLLVLEWGLTVVVAVVMAFAPGVGAAQLGLRRPTAWPGPVTWIAVVVVVVFVLLSTRSLRSGALARLPGSAAWWAGFLGRCPRGARGPGAPPGRPNPPRGGGGGGHGGPRVPATLALLPRPRRERHLFTVVGVTAGICEEWLYRGFF